MFRTDKNNNPTAFTTNIAKEAGLVEGTDYTEGTWFASGGLDYYTTRLLGDSVQITRRVISAISFYTEEGEQRWVYISLPKFVWNSLTPDQQRDVIGFMYQREGGTALRSLFPNYGEL